MVLAHRQELIWQARDKIEAVTGLRVDVEMGEYKASQERGLFHPQSQVIVSTVQTHIAGGDGGGRMTKFNPNDFGLLIIDECHHSTAEGYRKIINYYLQNKSLKVLGVTATPDRADEEALGQIFQTVAFDYEILDAINDGWIVPIEQQMVTIESLDLSAVRTQAGDLSGPDLDAVMMAEKNLHGVASSTLEIIGGKQGIGFAASVNHARVLADIFNRHKNGMASWVCGKTDEMERKKILADFARGEIQFVWNVGVFTEGTDLPFIEVVSMARPTKSRALYAQMAGRGFRPHSSIAHELNEQPSAAIRRSYIARSPKSSCLIIDFVGNSGRHKLVTTADILGGNYSDEAVQSAKQSALKIGRPVRMDKSIEEQEKLLEEKKKRELEEQARKRNLVIGATFKTQKIDPFDVLDIKPAKPRGWDEGKQISEKMRGVLRRAGYDADLMTYATAKQLVGVLISRWENHQCSIKQAVWLKARGYSPDLKMDEASKIMDSWKQNGWKRPKGNVKVPSAPTNGETISMEEPF